MVAQDQPVHNTERIQFQQITGRFMIHRLTLLLIYLLSLSYFNHLSYYITLKTPSQAFWQIENLSIVNHISGVYTMLFLTNFEMFK